MTSTLLLYSLPFLLLFLGFFQHIKAYNQDLGRHLLTGKIIVQTLHVPSTNLFSYTYPDFPFINHHWGAEVAFYLVNIITGNLGLFILSLVLILSAFALIFSEARKHASSLPLVFLALIYILILFDRTDIRPELFSFFYLSAMVTILYRNREKFTKLIFLLPVIELLWTNTHIYFPIGVLVTLLFGIDEVITKRKNLFNPHSKTLLVVLLITGAVTLINPHFLTGALYPLRVFQNYGYTIEENQTPFLLLSLGFTKPSFPYLEIAIGILLVSLLLSLRKSRPIDWLLFLIFTPIALSAVRNFPLFVFATFIPCARALSLISKPLLERISSRPPIWRILLSCGLVIFFIVHAKPLIQQSSFGYGVDEDAKPALDFMIKEHVSGPIFNNFDIGSYIESRLYPKKRVFIDGRPEAYPASFIQKTYIPMQQNPTFFEDMAKRYQFKSIIFSHTDQTPWSETFIKNILKDSAWIPIYLDSTMIILVKDTPENHSLIQKFGMRTDKLKITNLQTERDLRSAAHFYMLSGQTEQFEATLLQILQLHPQDCQILRVLVSTYIQRQDAAADAYARRYQLSCPE